jgi:4-hydroxy-2-oxoheptanedioate aldolase
VSPALAPLLIRLGRADSCSTTLDVRDSFADVLLLGKMVISRIDDEELKLKENPVKRALHAGKPQIGTWLSLGSIAAARFMARAGFPWLTVDMEHTHTDIQTATYMFGAIADAGCVPLARIPTGKHEYIKMVLDCGAMGIVAPMVMDAAEAEAIVAATKYPPLGNRSVGGGMHAMNFGATADEYYRRANDEILVVIQTEHIKAVDIADEIYRVPGLDAVFVGPNDLSFSMKAADGTPPGKDAFEATLTRIRESAGRNKLPCGLHVFSADDALKRAREGWQFIAVVSELKMMLDGAAQIVRQVDPERASGNLAKY